MRDVLKPILENGLCRMTRNHVQLALGLPDDGQVISGMGPACEIAIEVGMTQAVYAGKVPFHIARGQNDAVLSSGIGKAGVIPSEYIRSVFELKGGKYLH